MVQSFLWMQLNKEKDNPGLNRQDLAQIIAQSFNRRAYILVGKLYSESVHGLNIGLYHIQQLGQINTICHG